MSAAPAGNHISASAAGPAAATTGALSIVNAPKQTIGNRGAAERTTRAPSQRHDLVERLGDVAGGRFEAVGQHVNFTT